MKKFSKVVLSGLAFNLGLLVSGFGQAEIVFPTPHDGGTTVPKLPAFIYMRCNSTSTSANAQSRMQPFQAAGVYSVVYEVKSADMVSNGDTCIFTATTTADTIAQDSVNFSVSGGFVQAPGGGTPAFGSGASTFRVKYSSVRSYRAILALTNPPNLMIMPADGKSDGSEGGGGGDVIIVF